MGKKRLVVAMLAAILGATLLLSLLSRQPVYKGKALTAWLDQFGSSHWSNRHDLDHESEAAIRHFGTNQIPDYLKMLSTRPSPVKWKLLGHIPQTWAKRLHIPSSNDYELQVDATRSRGAHGLIALGPDAKPAVPALIALLTNQVTRTRYLSVFTIRCLGPVARDALPAVINCLKDPDGTVQIDAISALGTIHEDPEHVVPILIDVIKQTRNGPHLINEYSAIRALGDFKSEAAPAAPTIIKSLNDPDAGIRQAAALALGSIRARPDLTVPALIAYLPRARETSINDLMVAFGSLVDFGTNARPALPAIREYTHDADADVRRVTIDILKQIDPNAAAKAEIK